MIYERLVSPQPLAYLDSASIYLKRGSGIRTGFPSNTIANQSTQSTQEKRSRVGLGSKKIWPQSTKKCAFAYFQQNKSRTALDETFELVSLLLLTTLERPEQKIQKESQMKTETVSDVRERMSRVDVDAEPYSADEVAKAYGMSTPVILRHCRQEILPATKIGKSWEIYAKGVLEWRKRRIRS